MVIQNKKEPKKGAKCFAISIGGWGLGEGFNMVYGVWVRILLGRTVKRSCKWRCHSISEQRHVRQITKIQFLRF